MISKDAAGMATLAEQAVKGLDVREQGGVVRVRDGQDAWLCGRTAWADAIAKISGLDADDADEGGAEAYSRLCRAVSAPVASINGTSLGDIGDLVREAYALDLIDADDAKAYGVEVQH